MQFEVGGLFRGEETVWTALERASIIWCLPLRNLIKTDETKIPGNVKGQPHWSSMIKPGGTNKGSSDFIHYGLAWLGPTLNLWSTVTDSQTPNLSSFAERFISWNGTHNWFLQVINITTCHIKMCICYHHTYFMSLGWTHPLCKLIPESQDFPNNPFHPGSTMTHTTVWFVFFLSQKW